MTVTVASNKLGNARRKVSLIRDYVQQKQGSPWDLAPRARDLGDLREYRVATRLYRTLLDGGFTMISARRARMLRAVARRVDGERIPGAIVDCGVWNGGSTIMLHSGAPAREAWAFDSFEGLPAPGELDGPNSAGWEGECHGAEAKLRAGFARLGDPARLHVVKGWFADTFPTSVSSIGSVAVLHVDGDWYESVGLTLRTFYPQIPSGGWIVLDDYGHWIGARRAADDFRREVGDTTPMIRVDYAGRCWRKP